MHLLPDLGLLKQTFCWVLAAWQIRPHYSITIRTVNTILDKILQSMFAKNCDWH